MAGGAREGREAGMGAGAGGFLVNPPSSHIYREAGGEVRRGRIPGNRGFKGFARSGTWLWEGRCGWELRLTYVCMTSNVTRCVDLDPQQRLTLFLNLGGWVGGWESCNAIHWERHEGKGGSEHCCLNYTDLLTETPWLESIGSEDP